LKDKFLLVLGFSALILSLGLSAGSTKGQETTEICQTTCLDQCVAIWGTDLELIDQCVKITCPGGNPQTTVPSQPPTPEYKGYCYDSWRKCNSICRMGFEQDPGCPDQCDANLNQCLNR
jgi:hypothetical protein